MISSRRAWWVLAGALVLASAANAQIVLYDNLSAVIARYDGVNNNGPLYNSFSTGSSPVLLTQIQLYVDLIDGARGTVSVGLYADNGTGSYPGSLLTAIGIINDSLVTPAGSPYGLPVSPGYALTANTRYWIGLTTSNASLAGWAATTSVSGTGVNLEWSCNNGTQAGSLPAFQAPRPAVQLLTCTSNTIDPYLMQITVTSTSPTVPTLSTWGMLGLALLLMASSAWLIRRAQRTAS